MAISDLIQRAFRENNLIPVGTDPTADEQTEALAAFNGFQRFLFGIVIGEFLADWTMPGSLRNAPVAANYPQLPYPLDVIEGLTNPLATDPTSNVWPYPPQNSRIICGLTANTTAYLPELPNDGARIGFVVSPKMTATLTLDANGRTIEGAASKALTNASGGLKWFYRADLGDWIAMKTDFVVTDDSPLSSDYDDLFVTGIAIRLSSSFGAEIRGGTLSHYNELKKRAKTHYKQRGVTVYGSDQFPRSYQSYLDGPWSW